LYNQSTNLLIDLLIVPGYSVSYLDLAWRVLPLGPLSAQPNYLEPTIKLIGNNPPYLGVNDSPYVTLISVAILPVSTASRIIFNPDEKAVRRL
jgi:hypothetical protein